MPPELHHDRLLPFVGKATFRIVAQQVALDRTLEEISNVSGVLRLRFSLEKPCDKHRTWIYPSRSSDGFFLSVTITPLNDDAVQFVKTLSSLRVAA